MPAQSTLALFRSALELPSGTGMEALALRRSNFVSSADDEIEELE